MKNSPLSNVQKQFYINSIVYPKDTSYNIPLVYKICGTLNLDILEKSVNAIIRKYDVLRSSFKRNGRQLYRLTHEVQECVIKVEQVFLPNDFIDVNIEELDEEIHKKFNLDEWPLLRIKLFVYKNHESVLSFVFHHIIIDLHSYHIFVKELSQYYNKYIGNKTLECDVGNGNYDGFVNWESSWIKSKSALKMIDFWRNQLNERECFLNLPTDFKRPSVQSKQGKKKHFSFNEKITGDLQQLAQLYSVSIFPILLAAYALLCHQLSGQKRIVIGVPLSNRRIENNKNIFGPLINIVPIVFDFSISKTTPELIQNTRMALLNAHRNQEVPFLYLVNNLDVKKSFAYNPVFQVGFAYEPRIKFSFKGVKTKPLVIERKGSQLDLFYTIWEDDKEIHGCVEYSSDLFAEATIMNWIEKMKGIVDYFCESVDEMN